MNAPGPVQTHLQVSGNDLRDYTMVKRTIEQYFMAQKVWTASPSQSTATGSSAMQIDALTKGKGKKGRNKSKDVKSVQKGSAKSKDKDKGKGGWNKPERGGGSKYFEGNCNTCGKWGHRRADCWQNKSAASAVSAMVAGSEIPATGAGSSASSSTSRTVSAVTKAATAGK